MHRPHRTPASILAVGVLLTAVGLVVAIAPESCAAISPPPPRPPVVTVRPPAAPPAPRPATPPRVTVPAAKTPTTTTPDPAWYAPIIIWNWGSC